MKRTGVIVGTTVDISNAHANAMLERLNARFGPNVTFAVASCAQSVAFEFDDDEPEPWPAPTWSTHVPSVTEYPGPEEAFEPEYLEPRRKKPWR